MNKPDWTTVPKDAQFFSWGNFRKHENSIEYRWKDLKWKQVIFVKIERHKEQEDFEMRPTELDWNGPEDGLPPVGIRCLIVDIGDEFPDSLKEGTEVEILAHIITKSEIPVAVFRYDYGVNTHTNQAIASCFMPIKSERDRWVETALKECYHSAFSDMDNRFRFALGRIYDAGLAKLPT